MLAVPLYADTYILAAVLVVCTVRERIKKGKWMDETHGKRRDWHSVHFACVPAYMCCKHRIAPLLDLTTLLLAYLTKITLAALRQGSDGKNSQVTWDQNLRPTT